MIVRRIRLLVTVGVLVALAAPLLVNRDGLPLSTYPMYAHTRGSEVALVRVVALDAQGDEVALSIRSIADTRDPLVAQSALNTAVAEGRTSGLCGEVAERAPATVAQVQVVRERHDVVAQATGEPSLLGTADVLATCEAP